MTTADIDRMARIGRVLVDAALANADVRENMRRYPDVWTLDAVRRSPTCRVEWEHVHVISSVGEAFACASNKTTWGEFRGVMPLDPGDPVHPQRVLYCYLPTNPWSRRVEQRKAMKRLLGRRWRPLVGRALGETRGRFLASLTADEGEAIALRLKLDPIAFWRAAKGRTLLIWPKHWTTPRSLFETDTTTEED